MIECCEFAELFPGYPVKNRGICGEMIMRVEERVPDLVKGNSKKIFFRLGMVDILHAIDQEKLIASYQHMLKAVTSASPDTMIYVMGLQPAARKFAIANPRVIDLNKKMQEFCAGQERMQFVDLFDLFLGADGKLRTELTMDGVHINAAGYAIWKSELIKYF
jgi:lysophospholipase L1-like esterase